MTKLQKQWIIFVLALIGLGLSIELAVVYFNANMSKTALPSVCAINDFVDCDAVARSYHSQFAGIPFAWWGIALYLFIILMTFVDKLNAKFKTPLQVFKNSLQYLSALGLISFCISMTLACVSIFEIKKVCIFCMITYFINLAISLVATDFKAGGYIESFKTSFRDFVEGVKEFKILFTVVMMLAVGFLTYSTVSFQFVPHLKFHRSVLKYIKSKTNKYAIEGNTLGAKDGKVKLELITDYVCPMCRINNMVVHDVIRNYEDVEVIHLNYPLDRECHAGLAYQIHPGACMLSRIAIAAKKQGHYWDTASKLYDMKSIKTKELFEMAKSAGMDYKKLWYDALSPEVDKILLNDIAYCNSKGINATPSMIINGKKYAGLKNYEDLSKILDEHGATKRKK